MHHIDAHTRLFRSLINVIVNGDMLVVLTLIVLLIISPEEREELLQADILLHTHTCIFGFVT